MPIRKRWRAFGVAGVVAAVSMAGIVTAGASSHREAPRIAQDPVADNTDTYAFVAPDAPNSVTIVGNWIPLEAPYGGPNFFRFGEDVLYQFNIDNNGDAKPEIKYQFRFHNSVRNGKTFLYNTGPVTSLGDPDLNVRQSYTVTETRYGHVTTLASNVPVAPANIGPRSTPNYAALANLAIRALPGGIKVFAGPRDDPFFVDLGAAFDLGGLRPLNPAHVIPLPAAAGKDNLAQFNVHSIVMQIPKSRLVNHDPTIGVWASTYRQRTRVLDVNGHSPVVSGQWVQVSRLGMPLVNEVVIPLGAKNLFNAAPPHQDAQFGSYVLNPEFAGLIPKLYPGVSVPPNPRTDLATIFLTGIPGLNKQKNVQPSEMIRLNTAIAPTPWASQNRLGLLGGQMDGFPNGRRLGDDVLDIELRALAGGTPFTPAFNHFPNNGLTDGVDHNDVPFLQQFPYVATPVSGYDAN
ncbi:MAG: hypothetical protein JWL83_3861 [Actinomycetia bacterium]|nr:hypothetical protein [Actinomycetes bacterium]